MSKPSVSKSPTEEEEQEKKDYYDDENEDESDEEEDLTEHQKMVLRHLRTASLNDIDENDEEEYESAVVKVREPQKIFIAFK